MIRTAYTQRKVLEIYQQMDSITYPIHPSKIVQRLSKNCRMLSYQEMAKIAGCSIRDIAMMCKSNSGATHYDTDQDRYLILFNGSMNPGRTLWTQCHEIGHICLNHLDIIEEMNIAYQDDTGSYNQLESEADYFTWNLLAPLPIMREMSIQSVDDVKRTYGLSSQAAALQYDRYIKWRRSHIKTAWENQILREFRTKYIKTAT